MTVKQTLNVFEFFRFEKRPTKEVLIFTSIDEIERICAEKGILDDLAARLKELFEDSGRTEVVLEWDGIGTYWALYRNRSILDQGGDLVKCYPR